MAIDRDTPIGFIGTGIMGASMAGHILEAGYPLHVFNRTKEKAAALIKAGAVWEKSVAVLAAKCPVIFTMLSFPTDVREVYQGKNGLLKKANPGSYLIDTTTSPPDLAKNLYEQGQKHGLHVLDAPVTGGDIGAREAKLSIMVGGDEDDFQAILPLLRLLGTTVVHQGEAGAGQNAKICNQIALAGAMLGVCEALAYAEAAGLSQEKLLESIEHGGAASWALSHLGRRIIAGDFEPGFYIKHFVKDLKIASEEAEGLGLFIPATDLALSAYEDLNDDGYGDLGTQALYGMYAEDIGEDEDWLFDENEDDSPLLDDEASDDYDDEPKRR
jgi:3-hydroxyisobutyrate dehydrogenase